MYLFLCRFLRSIRAPSLLSLRDRFPLPYQLVGDEFRLVRCGDFAAPGHVLRSRIFRESVQSLNILAGFDEQVRKNLSASRGFLSSSQGSMLVRLAQRITSYLPDTVSGTDAECLQHLLKDKDYYGLDQFSTRRPFDRSKI